MISEETTEQQPQANVDNYWALLEPAKLVAEVKRRREEYLSFYEGSGILSRIKTAYCYFHSCFFDGYGISDAKIQAGGEEGEWDLIGINHFRSVLSLLKTYICSADIAWDCVAKKSSYATNEATVAGNEYLDCITSNPELGLQPVLKEAVQHALVMSAGYGWVLYDESLGAEKDADDEGTIYHEGALRFLNPCFLDVAYSLDVGDFRESPWVLVRRKENKYDLVAQNPSLKEAILKGSGTAAVDKWAELFAFNSATIEKKTSSDNVWVYYFYHRATPAIPDGRFVRFVNDKAVLKDEELKDGCVPVHQLLPSKWMLSAFGYTMAWDLIAPQEALHMAASTILTNQDKFGGNHVQFPAGNPVRIGEIEGVGTVFQTDGDIKSVQLLNNPAELFKSVDLWVATIERLSGVNASARGEPSPSMHAARAIEFTEQRTQQSASDLVSNYRQFLGEMGTSILKTLAYSSEKPTEYTAQTDTGQKLSKSLSPEQLKSLKSVSVVPGNPMLATIEGRTRLAETMMQQGVVKDAAQVVNVMKTGDLDPLMNAVDEKQLNLIKAENEALLRGEEIPPPADYDLHPEHIRGHLASISSPEARRDPNKAPFLLAHVAQHFQKMEDPLLMARMAVIYPSQPPYPALPGPNNPMTPIPGAAPMPPGPPAGPPPAAKAPPVPEKTNASAAPKPPMKGPAAA